MTKTKPSVEAMWQEFATTIGVPVGGVQWPETRFAFYAGVLATLVTLHELGAEQDVATGVVVLESLRQEAQALYLSAIDRAIEEDKKAGRT